MRQTARQRRDVLAMGAHVIGPDGEILTLADLPPPSLSRWVPRRKAQVIAAVRGGLLTIADACSRYRLSVEEFMEWERHYDAAGMTGLRASVRTPPQPPSMFH